MIKSLPVPVPQAPNRHRMAIGIKRNNPKQHPADLWFIPDNMPTNSTKRGSRATNNFQPRCRVVCCKSSCATKSGTFWRKQERWGRQKERKIHQTFQIKYVEKIDPSNKFEQEVLRHFRRLRRQSRIRNRWNGTACHHGVSSGRYRVCI